MASSTRAAPLWSSIILLAVLLCACVDAKPSIAMDYCSSVNTASMPANHSIYQSDGLCADFCRPSFALAIVHDDSCWCSNFVPNQGIQVATSQCSKPCPGFPDDVCGGEGLFGYMLLQQKPSGTIGSGSPTPSTSKSSSARVTTTETVQSTVTYIPPSPPVTSSDSSSTTSSSSSATTTDDSVATTQTPTVTTLTTGGQTKTVTVTPLPTGATASPNAGGVSTSPSPSAVASHGLSAGAAAGIAVAVIVAFLIAGGVLAWLWIKRRRARRAADASPNFSSNRGSSAGMTSTPRTGEMSETRYYMGPEHPPEPTRRRSTLMPVDPRLDPFAKGIYHRTENKSHDSVNTIHDEQDYSRRIQEPPRVLRAVNPDSDID